MEFLSTDVFHILQESAPYLLAGFLIAGLLNVLLNRYRRITSLLSSPGTRPIFLAALLGAPLPLCSCSVIPTALTLRRQGASKGTMASFLISVPETDVISISLTYALLGPVMAVARPVAAVFSAIIAGLAVQRWDGASAVSARLSQPEAQRTNPTPALDRIPDLAIENAAPRTKSKHWLERALHFGFVEMFDDIIVQILAGIVIAGAVVAWLPGLDIASTWGRSPAVYIVMLLLGVPVYVCASASTPLALGLVAGGVSPGAALVFLLAGPATNIASIVVLAKELGGRSLALYLVSIAFGALSAGVLLDFLFPAISSSLGATTIAAQSDRGALIETGAAVALLVLTVFSLRRTRRFSRWYSAIRKLFARGAS